jgi:hypothetical protein
MIKRAPLLALLLLAGCAKLLGYGDGGQKSTPVPPYPDGAAGLKSYFEDVLEAARRDERDRVHDLLANSIVPDAELVALFGPEAANEAVPRYHKMMETLVNRGGVELVAQVFDRKLDTIEVVPIDPQAPSASPEDRAIAAALKQPLTWYSVRVRRATDTRGLRYDFWFWKNGKWLTGNQVAKALPGYHPPDGGTAK